jgi:hypothetical protein
MVDGVIWLLKYSALRCKVKFRRRIVICYDVVIDRQNNHIDLPSFRSGLVVNHLLIGTPLTSMPTRTTTVVEKSSEDTLVALGTVGVGSADSEVSLADPGLFRAAGATTVG